MYEKIKAAVGGTDILAVIENLPVSASGFFLSADQMTQIDAALGQENPLAAELATVKDTLATAQTDLATAQSALATAQETATTATADLLAANAKIANLESKEGPAVVIASSDNHAEEAIAQKYLTPYDNM